DFLNGYFLTNAERIRNDPDHVVLHVPKDGPLSAEMVEQHWRLALEFFASSPGCVVPNLKVVQESLICCAKRYGIFVKAKGYGRTLKDWARHEAPHIRTLLTHTLTLCTRSKSSRSPQIRMLKEMLHMLLAKSGMAPEVGIEAALKAAAQQDDADEVSTPSSSSASPPSVAKPVVPIRRRRCKAPQVNMDELETQLEATMDAMMEARQDEPTDDSKRQALKETKPISVTPPEMPDVPDHTMELKESETDTDAYKAQLLQQKATRVESAKALVSKANSDNKVKKTQVKTGKGRGRGRGRGKAAKEISDDQPQEVAVRDDNAGDKPVPDDIDVSHPGEAIDGEKSDEENGGGDDGKKDKKTYKRKVFTPDELDAMWQQRVEEFKTAGISIPTDFDPKTRKSFTLSPPEAAGHCGTLGILWSIDQVYVNKMINSDPTVKKNARDIDMLELFSGEGTYGIDCRSFDILKNPMHDLTEPQGFFIALTKVLRVRRNGVIWGGNPCSSWIWISAHTTKRRSSMGVMGDESVPSVAIANCLAARFALIAMVAVIQGLWWCVEQPSSSLLPECPYMAHIMTNMMPAFSCRTWLGAFQHWCAKPTLLFGSWPSLGDLVAKMSKEQMRALQSTSCGMYSKAKRADGSTQAAQAAIAQGERRQQLVCSVLGVSNGTSSGVKRDRKEMTVTTSTHVTPDVPKKHCEGDVTPRALSFGDAMSPPESDHVATAPSAVSIPPQPEPPAPPSVEAPVTSPHPAVATPVPPSPATGAPAVMRSSGETPHPLAELAAPPPPTPVSPPEPASTPASGPIPPTPATAKATGTPSNNIAPGAQQVELDPEAERARYMRFTRRSVSKKAPAEITLKFREAAKAPQLYVWDLHQVHKDLYPKTYVHKFNLTRVTLLGGTYHHPITNTYIFLLPTGVCTMWMIHHICGRIQNTYASR
ncbi:unnamed protein product, partial [Cladocopium goreaui]